MARKRCRCVPLITCVGVTIAEAGVGGGPVKGAGDLARVGAVVSSSRLAAPPRAAPVTGVARLLRLGFGVGVGLRQPRNQLESTEMMWQVLYA